MADTCWYWARCTTPDGYGAVTVNNRRMTAHRLVYEALVEEVPEGMELDHLCRNRNCVNPGHLEIVTHRENCLRAADYRHKGNHEPRWSTSKQRVCLDCRNEGYYARKEKISG